MIKNVTPIRDVTPTKITLQVKKQKKSSDIVENINCPSKMYVVRELGLNLGVDENNRFTKIFKNMQLGQITKSEAFLQIKAEIKDSDDYNDAEVSLKIGGRRKKVKWNEFESMMGAFDISEKLHNAYSKSENFEGELSKIVDEYYQTIIEHEVI